MCLLLSVLVSRNGGPCRHVNVLTMTLHDYSSAIITTEMEKQVTGVCLNISSDICVTREQAGPFTLIE